MASSTSTTLFFLLLVATSSMMMGHVSAGRIIPQSYTGVDPGIQFELLTAKRGDGYGWNDCEFSPLSCLLKRRRRSA
ncbi:Neuropeptide-Like Protein [Caenorhabditis elegans]|uniref:Neuropeptide-Like Protein n=1 Tax=Caenorhabditis elegans TaxID=6239 RepID=O44858_CAEEL|nr:Uncharacterized protein CELE_T05A8.3 [Caenorhabditis elegans]CCD73585.2 Uncharacterized protein CELE_T05A8.3 [Caenorhabditis elegans]|eukprot:NP_494342.2 Uncharacterized protein CELE_T05A8.3 [Caenorhabditis elegans]